MKRILLAILVLSVSALAQNPGGRLGDSQPIRSKTTLPSISVAFPTLVPNATIQVCDYPANAVPCTNLTTTYTDATLGTACSTSTQITYAGSNSCVGATDADGFWGVWVFPGQYEWTYTLSDGTSHGPYPAIVTGLVAAGGGGGGGATFDPGANTYMVYVDNAQTGNVGTDPVFNYDKNTHTLSVPQMAVTGAGGYQFVGKAGTMSGSGDATKSNCGFDSSNGGQLSCGNLGAAPKEMLRAGEVNAHTDVVTDGVVVTNFNADMVDGSHANVTPGSAVIPIAASSGRIAPGFIPTGQVQPTAGTGSPLTYTTLAADYGRVIKSNMAGGGTIQLMNAPIGGYFFWANNINSTAVVIDAVPVCACFLNGVSTALSLPQGQTVVVWSDGTNYFSSIPVVGAVGSGATVSQSGQKLVVSSSGSQVSGWCQGLPAVGASFVSVMVGFKAANNVLCTDSTAVEVPVTAAFVASALYCKAGTAGAAADSGNCFLYKNGAQPASGLTCTMGTGTSCSDTTHTVTFAAGDTYSLRMVNDAAGSDTIQNVRIAVLWK